MLSFLRRARKGTPGVGAAPRVFGSGFNGGPGRTPAACRAAPATERSDLLREAGFADAGLVHRAGGNMLRVFYSVMATLAPRDDHKETTGVLCSSPETCYLPPLETRLQRLDVIDNLLDRVRTGLADGVAYDGSPLGFADHDAYLAGIERFNDTLGTMADRIQVLLTALIEPPRWILEAPRAGLLKAQGRAHSFQSLWQRFLKLQTDFARLVVRRYLGSAARGGTDRPPAVSAFEVCNEPDYEWLPDEYRIEWSANPGVNPLGKYVTELHLDMIPEHPPASFSAFETTPWGFRAQDAEWRAREPEPAPLGTFNWGAKFDWYVRCFAELQEHLARAIKDQARRERATATVVAGSVTHNNIDYLCRMFQQNPNAFTHVDAVGVHPYHWVRHDIWDRRFVSPKYKADWRDVSPRAYARDYCKRFDFLEEIARLVRMTDVGASYGLAGKRLWVTEFGIPTKKMGAHNQRHREYTKFIRQRHEPELEFPSVVWEDLWDAFFAQVDRAYLERNGVEVFLFYGLRELDRPGLDLHDDDRSNLSVLHTDGRPRLPAQTHERLTSFLKSLSVQSRA